MSWGEGEARTCLAPRLDDSNVQISLGACSLVPQQPLTSSPSNMSSSLIMGSSSVQNPSFYKHFTEAVVGVLLNILVLDSVNAFKTKPAQPESVSKSAVACK